MPYGSYPVYPAGTNFNLSGNPISPAPSMPNMSMPQQQHQPGLDAASVTTLSQAISSQVSTQINNIMTSKTEEMKAQLLSNISTVIEDKVTSAVSGAMSGAMSNLTSNLTVMLESSINENMNKSVKTLEKSLEKTLKKEQKEILSAAVKKNFLETLVPNVSNACVEMVSQASTQASSQVMAALMERKEEFQSIVVNNDNSVSSNNNIAEELSSLKTAFSEINQSILKLTDIISSLSISAPYTEQIEEENQGLEEDDEDTLPPEPEDPFEVLKQGRLNQAFELVLEEKDALKTINMVDIVLSENNVEELHPLVKLIVCQQLCLDFGTSACWLVSHETHGVLRIYDDTDEAFTGIDFFIHHIETYDSKLVRIRSIAQALVEGYEGDDSLTNESLTRLLSHMISSLATIEKLEAACVEMESRGLSKSHSGKKERMDAVLRGMNKKIKVIASFFRAIEHS